MKAPISTLAGVLLLALPCGLAAIAAAESILPDQPEVIASLERQIRDRKS